MPRRKQICPKRMKYDAKGQEIEDTSPDSNSPSADEQSETETSPMGSPSSPIEPLSPDDKVGMTQDSESMEGPRDDSVELRDERGHGHDTDHRPSKRPRIMDPVTADLSLTIHNMNTSPIRQGLGDVKTKVSPETEDATEEKPPKASSDTHPTSPNSPENISSQISRAETSITCTSSKTMFQNSTSPPAPTAKPRGHSEDGAKSRSLEVTKVPESGLSRQHSMDVPKLVPTPVKSSSSSDRHDRTFTKQKSDMYQDTREGDRERHRSRHSHGGSHRKPYSERVRDRHHLRESMGSRNHSGDSAEHSAYKSLAKKYADLFKSSTKVDIKSVKEDKSRVSYEPLKAVQDMVKAAERRSPVTPPQANYHTRFDYLKRLTGSPSSLEALQRVAEKDRSISLSASTPEKRPSVVQSVSKTYSSPNYQKYLQLPPTNRDKTPPRTLDPDPDKPLDLSVKPKKKKDSPRSSSSSSSTKRSHESMSRPFLSPPLPPEVASCSSPSSMASTLASMEQKFGDNSFMFDRIGSKHFNTPIRQFYMSAFGMGIYSTALNNSYPFPANTLASLASSSSSTSVFSQSLMASNKSPISSRSNEGQSPSRKSSISSLPPPSEDTSKSYVPSKFLEQAIKESGIDPKRHTNLQCSCGDEFETLYHLTLHLQETGHPANKTKNGTQHDYPKLVRGQDMWLNHGSEQTKQILRCMQCGVSFKSLPELTVHMIQTKHYTNIVGSETPTKSLKPLKPSLSDCSDSEYSSPHKCPKCQELFEDFAGLVRHQDKTGHLTLKCEQDLDKGDLTSPRPPSVQSDRDTTNSGATPSSSSNGSIVHFKRHLLESLNEHRSHAAHDDDSHDSSFSSHSVHEASRIRCENCADKIKTEHFVEHVRQCVKHMRSPARARSRSRSPIDKKFRDYFNGEFHVRRQLIKEESSNVRSQDYTSRLDQEDKYPYYRDYKSPADDKGHLRAWTAYNQEARSKDACPKPDSSQSVPRDFTINSSTELVKPPDTDKDGCALRAMESFIERSFSHNAVRKPAQSSSLFSTSLFARNFFASHAHQAPPRPPERNTRADRLSPVTRRDSPSPQQDNSHLYQNKYLPPLYAAPDHVTADNAQLVPSPKSPASHPVKEEFPETLKLDRPLANGIQNPLDKNDNTVLDTSSALRKLEAFSDADKQDQEASLGCQKKKLQSDNHDNGHQELHEDTDVKKDDSKEAVSVAKSSALQSLQGLVYGKSFNTEHPLDSLQKLIHTGSVTSTCHTLSSSRAVLSPSLVSSGSTTTLPGTVILVNPIVTVVSNSKGGSPSLQISLPPPSPGDSKDRHSPYSDSYSNHDNKSPTLTGDGDSNSENRCDACNRNFASKGSYRYHQSRCHWSTVKKFRIKEAINTSPYVYLPLDHSAKFNKYYEMANELASKGK